VIAGTNVAPSRVGRVLDRRTAAGHDRPARIGPRPIARVRGPSRRLTLDPDHARSSGATLDRDPAGTTRATLDHDPARSSLTTPDPDPARIEAAAVEHRAHPIVAGGQGPIPPMPGQVRGVGGQALRGRIDARSMVHRHPVHHLIAARVAGVRMARRTRDRPAVEGCWIGPIHLAIASIDRPRDGRPARVVRPPNSGRSGDPRPTSSIARVCLDTWRLRQPSTRAPCSASGMS
jgi:hypothetical protein